MVRSATALGHARSASWRHLPGRVWQADWLGNVTRFINDILLSAPSIVIGLFIYAMIVAQVRGFSGLRASLALALIVIPVVVRATENMLQLVPNALREAALRSVRRSGR
jgi:phosphate transport system permease protein